MSRIEYLELPSSYFNPDEFIAHLGHIADEDDLFNRLASVLKFPEYFGHNWNAVSDCLRDFHWVSQSGIVLIHNELPMVDMHTLTVYLQVIVDAVQDWKPEEEHYFKAIFPIEAKPIMEQVLGLDSTSN